MVLFSANLTNFSLLMSDKITLLMIYYEIKLEYN